MQNWWQKRKTKLTICDNIFDAAMKNILVKCVQFSWKSTSTKDQIMSTQNQAS